ncbi:GTPase-activating protein GYP6 Ecym_8243 [Eremothecium cymbalariae DBVPG|uniref:Rab-GAP TBC domain-containing protein n=1 Tax=Eremothecium cymbalariae (strain CBS 270.75 / DBVPG 7215 / KCTC 17166 / NRRL Y-17582) TaxID=931890 RepID=G8JXF3_ERECY|nr:Hypothetical protein Ecym_8243 [Eremothecium cymbalariae DBVPG\
MNMSVQHLVNKYHSKEQLSQTGIWEGVLYEADTKRYLDRGWCWKILLLSEVDLDEWSEMEQPVAATYGVDKVRNLTEGHLEQLREVSGDMVVQDDRLKERASLEEQVEIITLDVQRLLIDRIFAEQNVQDDMIAILSQYTEETGRPYKQGYHELCGILYMQLYHNGYRESIRHTSIQMVKCFLGKVAPTFYDEGNLIQWTKETFEPMLSHASPQIYEQLLFHHQLDNSIWLIRWTRLLFLREFDLDYTIQLWDHILTFRYPVPELVAAIAVVSLVLVVQELHSCEDHGDLMALLLHYPVENLTPPRQLMKTTKLLVEYWLSGQHSRMQPVCDTLIEEHNSDWYRRMKDSADSGQRLRLEERLKRRAESRLKGRASVR